MSSSENATTIISFLDNAIKTVERVSQLNGLAHEMGPRWRAGSLGAGIILFMYGRL